MKVMVTGAGGLLGRAVVDRLRLRGDEVVALTRAGLDVTDEAAARACLESERPDAVVHCAAYTAVDRAEAEADAAFRVNADAARIVARACQRFDALFVYPSTDYVFAGDASRPYRPDDEVDPINAYGRSKAAGERAAREAGRALIVRTSWLYGGGGGNFVDTILRLARERGELTVVDDQWGRPTWCDALATTLAELITAGAVGTFHATDGGEAVTWHGLAAEILARSGVQATLERGSTHALQRAAPRPRYSVLDCEATERLLGRPMPDWKESLQAYLELRDPA